MSSLDSMPRREPALHDLAVAAYDARRREFQDDRTWSAFERVAE
jgi:hypothetical protein